MGWLLAAGAVVVLPLAAYAVHLGIRRRALRARTRELESGPP